MLYAEPWLKILHWQYAPKSGTLCRYDGSGDAIVLEPRLHSLLNFFCRILSKLLLKNTSSIVSGAQIKVLTRP